MGAPPKLVGKVYPNAGEAQLSATPLPVVKCFSHVGKVLGAESREGRPVARISEGTSWGPTMASAPWKGSESTPENPTYSPQRRVPFL